MYLFLYFIVFFLLVFVIRSYLSWKRTGINPITFNKTDDAHGFNGKVFLFVSIIELIVIGIYALKESWYEYLLPFWYLEHPALVKVGWAFLLIALILIWVAQSQMADSWRIGIDEKNKSELVTKGLFSLSRNPIFLGVIIANIGVFLVVPNAFTLVIISLSILGINTQIRLEEEFLKHEFGAEYMDYMKKVRRWL